MLRVIEMINGVLSEDLEELVGRPQIVKEYLDARSAEERPADRTRAPDLPLLTRLRNAGFVDNVIDTSGGAYTDGVNRGAKLTREGDLVVAAWRLTSP